MKKWEQLVTTAVDTYANHVGWLNLQVTHISKYRVLARWESTPIMELLTDHIRLSYFCRGSLDDHVCIFKNSDK